MQVGPYAVEPFAVVGDGDQQLRLGPRDVLRGQFRSGAQVGDVPEAGGLPFDGVGARLVVR
ncbi:hypothetical protein DTL70_00190 [Streptomyces diacarni]|uniref:Uncharacterized protein n=1 Tax=Streptomyces diacarni TaxID=2800381 RepID=A0A367FFX9_9ACTN|nr:hypothetical protein DTL70_00190 [Streptomyces diacarni]